MPWYYYIFIIVINLIGSYAVYFDDTTDYRGWITYTGTGLFLFVAIVTVIYAYFLPRKIVIFDRLNGTITIGGPYWVKPLTIPFSDVEVFMRTEQHYLASLNALNVYRPDIYKQDVSFNCLRFEDIEADWAFFLWYMDKTRELPPGKALDPFRTDDEKRRQSDLNLK